MVSSDDNDLLRALPSVEKALAGEAAGRLLASYSRAAVVSAYRSALEGMRSQVQGGDGKIAWAEDPMAEADARATAILGKASARTMREAINATGVIIHTNLGRSPLSREATAAMLEAAGYCTVEIEPESGKRGSRQTHVSGLLAALTGSEDGMAVNNNAAAVMLVLSALARGREVVVSRGELIEIGGSFRIPEIMALSGARLVEVGTTNKTHLRDYERAIGPETGLVLKVHPSNYSIEGFTNEVTIDELAPLCRERGLPLFYDAGSGLLVDLSPYIGPGEMTVQRSLLAGADLVSFSGDKLLGGPQAGLIAGSAALVSRLRNDHMARALRLDKVSLAALEATLRQYMTTEPLDTIPVLEMISRDIGTISARADSLLGQLHRDDRDHLEATIVESEAKVGGGATPAVVLPSRALRIRASGLPADELSRRLRAGQPPLFTTIVDDAVSLDLRSMREDEPERAVALVLAALRAS